MFDIIGGLADKSTRLAITREIIENVIYHGKMMTSSSQHDQVNCL